MPKPTKKSITFITRTAPYGSVNPNLCMDMVLACAVFEQQVNYVFLDDGVYQLRKGQNAEVLNRKTLGNALETLDLYGVENVLVESESLLERAMSAEDLVVPVKTVTNKEIGRLLQDSFAVFNL